MGTGDLQGWHADPFKIHEARYFSGGQPTKLVRDGSAESYDDLPAGGWDPAAAAITATGAGAAQAAVAQAAGTQAGAVQATAAQGALGPVETGGPAPGWLYGAAHDASPYGPGLAPQYRRRNPGALAGIALLGVAVMATCLMIAHRPGAAPAAATPSGLSPVAFVTQSAQRTLAQRTADMTLSAAYQFGGQNGTERGTGELNFSTDAMTMDLVISVRGHQTELQEILVNGVAYVTGSVDGKSLALPGGRAWLRTKVSTSSGSGSSDNGDPYTLLASIERQGMTLRPLGTKVIGGVTCTGYAVTSLADGGSPATFTIWADSQRLVREMTMGMQLSASGSAIQAGLTMDFTNFGQPVHITAPSPASTYAL
jgi:hypothetical protein